MAETRSMEERKRDFLGIYASNPKVTMFKAADMAGLSPNTLVIELRSDRSFFNEVKAVAVERARKDEQFNARINRILHEQAKDSN